MYLVEVLAPVYILCQGNAAVQFSSVATFRLQSSGSELVRVLCVCVCLSSTPSSTSSHSECAGKLVAYLCRAARDQHMSC
jgi:hypothetical protein